jgi:hypothetical protein
MGGQDPIFLSELGNQIGGGGARFVPHLRVWIVLHVNSRRWTMVPLMMAPSLTQRFSAVESMACSVWTPSESTIRKRSAAFLVVFTNRTSMTCSTGFSLPSPSPCSEIAATARGVSCAAAIPSLIRFGGGGDGIGGEEEGGQRSPILEP